MSPQDFDLGSLPTAFEIDEVFFGICRYASEWEAEHTDPASALTFIQRLIEEAEDADPELMPDGVAVSRDHVVRVEQVLSTAAKTGLMDNKYLIVARVELDSGRIVTGRFGSVDSPPTRDDPGDYEVVLDYDYAPPAPDHSWVDAVLVQMESMGSSESMAVAALLLTITENSDGMASPQFLADCAREIIAAAQSFIDEVNIRERRNGNFCIDSPKTDTGSGYDGDCYPGQAR